jgi:pimeloyl-ACP methyl ester carboxylesterase
VIHLLFVHGQPGAGSDFDEVIAHLPPGLDPLAPDRPGYRSNPLPAGGAEDNARWLVGELDRAGIARTVLVGHSYGGGIALMTAAMFPERVQALILVASTGPQCLARWDHALAAPVIGPVCAVAAFPLAQWAPRAALAVIARRLGRPLRVDEHVDLATWAYASHEHGQVWRSFLVEQRDLVHHEAELVAAAHRVRSPTLILADPDDDIVPIVTARALHASVSGSRLQLVDGGGHALPRTRPQVVARAIADALATG